MNDRQLVQAARGGSMEALRDLYARYARAVYWSAFRILGTEADAQDVLQDVFVGLPKALSRFDGARPLEPWLRRVAARLALMKRRSSDRRDRRDSTWASGARYTSEHATADARLDLARIVGTLPIAQRDVYLLKELEGFSHAEIADLLGISERASVGRLHRAWKTIRDRKAKR